LHETVCSIHAFAKNKPILSCLENDANDLNGFFDMPVPKRFSMFALINNNRLHHLLMVNHLYSLHHLPTENRLPFLGNTLIVFGGGNC
jgi:hypothetical protein